MVEYTKDKLPAWPILRDGMDPADIIRRRSDLRVGAIVFTFDENRRYYVRDNRDRNISGMMLKRYCFGAFTVIGETRMSWVLSNRDKAPKRNPANFYGIDDVEDWLWVHDHRWRIESHIGTIKDAAVLRQIADLIGYVAKDAEQ